MLSAILHFFKRKQKERKKLFYGDFILMHTNDNNINITAVHNLDLIKTLPFEEGVYETVNAFIKNGNINAVRNMEVEEGLLGELAVVIFKNQTGEPCVAILYDSYETWEQPVVAEVIKLNETT